MVQLIIMDDVINLAIPSRFFYRTKPFNILAKRSHSGLVCRQSLSFLFFHLIFFLRRNKRNSYMTQSGVRCNRVETLDVRPVTSSVTRTHDAMTNRRPTRWMKLLQHRICCNLSLESVAA